MPKYPYRILGSLLDRIFRNNLNDNFKDIETDFIEHKTRVDNLLQNNPQPSEVVDLRMDSDGIVHPVAADRFASDVAKTNQKIDEVNVKLAQRPTKEEVLFQKLSYSKLIKYPTEVTSHKLPINIYNKMNEYYTDLNPRDHKPVRTNTYYVNPVIGNDANDGLTATTPFKTINKALTMTGDNEIILNAGVYYYNDGWKGVDPARGISVICKKGIAVLSNEAYPRRWVEDATYPGMYTAPTVYNGEDLLAVNPDIRYVVKGYEGATSLGAQLTAQSVANIQSGTVGVSVGSGTIYIRLPNNLNPNDALTVRYSRDNVICKANSLVDSTIYLENIVAEYGNTSPLLLSCSTKDSKIVLVNAKALYGRYGNGAQITSNGLAIMWGCEASNSWLDGFNYQLNSGVSGSTLLDVVEVNCKGYFNGRDTSGANNGSTVHGSIRIIRLNCDYQNNQNRNVHDVGTGWSFNVGVQSRYSQENNADFATRSEASSVNYKMWLVGCNGGKLEAMTNNGGSTIYKEIGHKFANEIGTVAEFDPYY